MKKICNLLICLFISSIFLVSCNDMLGVDSQRLISQQNFGHSPNDVLYSTFGVLSQMQKLADSYVLLGELRGDLLNTTPTSDISLNEINNFTISGTNTYVNIKDYYAVINNCNYILQNLDSTVVVNGQKLQLGQMAAIKSIRAWTYMQIALNFKTAKYYDKAILTVEDSKKVYPDYDINQLADVLIADLIPVKDIPFQDLGYVGTYNTIKSYFPISLLLGDLYLWKGEYEKSATEYYDFMYKFGLVISGGNSSAWLVTNKTITNNAILNWMTSFTPSSSEIQATITCPTQYGQKYALDSLNYQHKLAPSTQALSNWDTQTYYLNDASNAQGDLRKYGSISWGSNVSAITNVPSSFSVNDITSNPSIILKYKIYNQNVVIYRNSLLYLRYAEAVNRLNKPNLAFAVLKYGLNSINMYNPKIIPANEKDASASYMNFSDPRFNNNVGIRMRGLGACDKDTTFYTFKKQNTLNDSVLYVEDLIQKELALETAFEGNRFTDLMRIALRRIKNGEADASYLADPVSAKHVGNEATIKKLLMNPDNWYIKTQAPF
jgi:hypothetical protein